MRALAVAALLTFVACDHTPPPKRPPSPTRAAAPTESTSPVAAPSASASAPAVAKETSPFNLVATGEQLRLFQLGAATFLTEGCESGGPFASARLAEGGVVLDPMLTEGWSYCVFCACEFQGSYPDRVYRAGPRSPSDGCTTQALNLKQGARWKYVGGPGGGQLLVSSWSKGRKLVVGQNCGGFTEIAVLDRKTGLITPAQDAPSLTALASQNDSRPGALIGFASFESGEVLMLFGPIFDLPARLAVWRNGKRAPVISTLTISLDDPVVAFTGPDGLFVAAQTSSGPKLNRYDGHAWTELPVTGPTKISVMRVAAGGGLWIAGGDSRLWHRGADGAWTSLLLPPHLRVLDLVELAPGDVWLASSSELFRNRATKPVQLKTRCPGTFEGSDDQSLSRCQPELVPISGG